MSMIGTIAMVAAGIGAVVGMRKVQAGNAAAKPVALGCVVLTLVLAVWGIVPRNQEDRANQLLDAASKFNFASGETLGRHLAEKFDGSRVLVLVGPVSGEQQTALLDGLKQGLGSGLEWVDTVQLEAPEAFMRQRQRQLDGMEGLDAEWAKQMLATEAMSYWQWFDSSLFRAILAKHEGSFDVLVSTVGLPLDFSRRTLAIASALPEIALLNASPHAMRGLLSSGVIDAAVVYKPDPQAWKDTASVPRKTADAFAKRYILVTPENIDEISSTYPELFGNP